jgi:hypothetical protein
MVSQLQQEVTQCTRSDRAFVPLPDSGYIISNLPSARQVPVTTATKSGRVSKPSAKKRELEKKATEALGKKKKA